MMKGPNEPAYSNMNTFELLYGNDANSGQTPVKFSGIKKESTEESTGKLHVYKGYLIRGRCFTSVFKTRFWIKMFAFGCRI